MRAIFARSCASARQGATAALASPQTNTRRRIRSPRGRLGTKRGSLPSRSTLTSVFDCLAWAGGVPFSERGPRSEGPGRRLRRRERFMRARSIVLPALAGLGLASPAPAGGCVNCYRHVVTPPVYGSVAEQVMVRAPRTVAHTVPGEYASVAEQVLCRRRARSGR